MGYIILVMAAFATIHFSMSEMHQERATMDWNPKYMSNGTAFTKRAGRGKSYSTNITGTSLYSWSDNVTVNINVLTLKNHNIFQMRKNLCELFNVKWVIEFLKAYSNVPPNCPVPAGHYGFYNFVMPPKNFPIALISTGPNSELRLIIEMINKPTNERICSISIILRI